MPRMSLASCKLFFFTPSIRGPLLLKREKKASFGWSSLEEPSLSLSPSLCLFSISSREKIERGAMEEEDSSHSSTIEEELHDSEPLAATSRIRDQNTGDVVDAAEDDDERNGDRAELPNDSESDWTDEKHSMYLQSMEDEFVRSLYAMKRPQQAEAQNLAMRLVTKLPWSRWTREETKSSTR
ncbi:uncharacterized protein LOC9638648 isoform X2 [Selaginella moellendorffii]|uniref:uncharacterized protein LOC9638648 isoform X2 n=1 Tax=Selaginella moellendorffii TaxID=88036 RepID=UPI000D1CE53E|nr:uncharacterized protein LOC9638648 isoform X2 [Selaginella moellendorffii]|eukprot:XP_024537882.1 uncharacterized protein LOC9638648 isoform X2 [Selaginella moellendorffii]